MILSLTEHSEAKNSNANIVTIYLFPTNLFMLINSNYTNLFHQPIYTIICTISPNLSKYKFSVVHFIIRIKVENDLT